MDESILEAVEALQGQDGTVRALFDAFPQKIWTALPNGQPDYVNAPFYAFTNWAPGRTTDHDWISLIHEDDITYSMQCWRHSLQTANPFEVEQRIKRAADGAFIWHLVRAVPVKDEAGRVVRWIGTSVDIHRQKQTEERLSRFVYLASHDLNGPLNNIKAVLELFRTMPKKDWDQLREFLEISSGKLEENLKKIVRQVTDPLKKETATELNLAVLIDKALDMGLQEELDRKGGTIETDFSQCSSVNYVASELLVIFQTLIANAIQYAHTVRELKLKISSRKVDNFVLLRFEDNGSGINLEQFGDKLFMPFARFHGKKSGHGLGLYLLKSMLVKSGGKVEMETEAEQGTRFLIYLKNIPMA